MQLILIADDTRTSLEVVQSVLDAEGFRTLTASDGAAARALSRTEKPDLILLDVLMPGESGFETCAYLKSDPAPADIPVIFLSALDDEKNKVTGLKVGGVDYVPKPVHGEERRPPDAHRASPMWYGMAEWNSSQSWITNPRCRSIASCMSRLHSRSATGNCPEGNGCRPLANWLACLD